MRVHDNCRVGSLDLREDWAPVGHGTSTHRLDASDLPAVLGSRLLRDLRDHLGVRHVAFDNVDLLVAWLPGARCLKIVEELGEAPAVPRLRRVNVEDAVVLRIRVDQIALSLRRRRVEERCAVLRGDVHRGVPCE